MPGSFYHRKFAELDLSDPFFDSLKADYPGSDSVPSFEKWFIKKATEGREALVFSDEYGLGAFVCMKDEEEPLDLQSQSLPKKKRCKISTIKIAERFRGQRLGEGAIGLVLWRWRDTDQEDVYVTVFEKQAVLISQLERYGFCNIGLNTNGENVYLRSKRNIDYSDPYKSFPFINPSFTNAGYLCVQDSYHDTLFPYSELKNTLQQSIAVHVRNGMSKIYVGAQTSVPYRIGEPILIYRKHEGTGKRYKSCLTSFCIVTNIICAKQNNVYKVSFDDLINRIGNKSVFDQNEIRQKYLTQRNMFVIEMLYSGFFGEGNNVNLDWLDTNGFWCAGKNATYPTEIRLTPGDFRTILQRGAINVDNVIID